MTTTTVTLVAALTAPETQTQARFFTDGDAILLPVCDLCEALESPPTGATQLVRAAGQHWFRQVKLPGTGGLEGWAVDARLVGQVTAHVRGKRRRECARRFAEWVAAVRPTLPPPGRRSTATLDQQIGEVDRALDALKRSRKALCAAKRAVEQVSLF